MTAVQCVFGGDGVDNRQKSFRSALFAIDAHALFAEFISVFGR